MSHPGVSIVLPTLNAMATLSQVLNAIDTQEIDSVVETVVVDSGSTDGTVELLRQRVDRVIAVAPGSFNHGLTRNLGIEATRGELVVLLVQDAVPASPHWLAALTGPLVQAGSVEAGESPGQKLAGTFARQLPRAGASRITRHALGRWVAAQETPHTHSVENLESFLALPPEERFVRCVFDNVCSCLRRRVWEKHPFRATPIAEDLEWAKEVLLAGYELAYIPAATVVHSHERSPFHELRRTYLVHRRLHELFGLRTIPTLPKLVRSVSLTLLDHARCLLRDEAPRPGAAEILRTLGLALSWPLGQYLGGRAADNGQSPVVTKQPS